MCHLFLLCLEGYLKIYFQIILFCILDTELTCQTIKSLVRTKTLLANEMTRYEFVHAQDIHCANQNNPLQYQLLYQKYFLDLFWYQFDLAYHMRLKLSIGSGHTYWVTTEIVFYTFS